MKTGFIEGSILLSSILEVKSKYFDECFVKNEEFLFVRERLHKMMNSLSMCYIINDRIDNIYYEIRDGIFLCNRKNSVTLNDVIEHFNMYINDYNLEQIIYDEEFIYNSLLYLKEEQLNKLKNNRNQKVFKKGLY